MSASNIVGRRASMTNVHLLRRLGFKESFAIVVGSIIGTGIFLKTAVMAQDAGSPLYVLLAWLVAGVLSFMGALIYAELGCLFPAAGGEYVFLREAYGPLTGFLFGWTRFWIASPGSIAAYAIGCRDVSRRFLPMARPPARDGDRDHRLFHRAQLLLRSLRRSRANRDDRREDSHDLRAGGVDIDVRSGHELGSSQRRGLISGMEELVRLRVGGSRGTLGFRRLEQSVDGGGRNSRSGSRDSASRSHGDS